MNLFRVFAIRAAASSVLLVCSVSLSQTPDPPPPLSLKTVPVPEPDNLTEFVLNRNAAIQLGKALFWDMQVGSDGVVACATCHFNAGADSRNRNQLNPGSNRFAPDYSPSPDRTFDKGLNASLTASDFPFHKLANPDDRLSVVSDTNDVASSQGVFFADFHKVIVGGEQTTSAPDPDGFRIGGSNVRRVEPRNTPTVINAIFNFRNFWDGRAQNDFNGVNHLGSRDATARVYLAAPQGALVPVQISLNNASLASQAVAPPLSAVEMSAAGRTFQDISRKFSKSVRVLGINLVRLRPLGKQLVHRQDSVLGSMSRWPFAGLTAATYESMIRAAFRPKWWNSSRYLHVDDTTGAITVLTPQQARGAGDNVYSHLQYNFALFFGLAIQMYEATLVSDNTPFDRFREGDTTALTPLEQQGLALFLSQSRGRCINCHGGSEFTDASVSRIAKNRLRRREGQLIDTGFNNIGVRPTLEDIGLGATDGSSTNAPLAESRLAMGGLFVDPALNPPVNATDVVAVDGAFKIPGLRNVELTAPYFHNGGELTLRTVIDFYSRGGNFVPVEGREGEIVGLHVLNLTEDEKNALVAFLKSLTDERVRYRRAPFDHPQLFVPNGHIGTTTWVIPDLEGGALDLMMKIPPVGRTGGAPLPEFPN